MNDSQKLRVWLMITVAAALLQYMAWNLPPDHGIGTVIDGTGVHVGVPITTPSVWFLPFALGSIGTMFVGSIQVFVYASRRNHIIEFKGKRE